MRVTVVHLNLKGFDQGLAVLGPCFARSCYTSLFEEYMGWDQKQPLALGKRTTGCPYFGRGLVTIFWERRVRRWVGSVSDCFGGACCTVYCVMKYKHYYYKVEVNHAVRLQDDHHCISRST